MMPRISIAPGDGRFLVQINGCAVRECADELDAHHWGKHAFEAVNRGLRTPAEIRRNLASICLTQYRYNMHP
jgi:hypothetical protein